MAFLPIATRGASFARTLVSSVAGSIGIGSGVSGSSSRPRGSITISTNGEEWNRALAQYIKLSKSTLPEIINRKMFFVLRGAYQGTKVVSRREITRDLGTRRRPKPLAFKIYNSNRRGTGRMTREQVFDGVGRMITSRQRGRGITRAGWVNSIRTFGRAARIFAGVRGKPIKQKSIGFPGKNGWNPKAISEYRLTHTSRGGVEEVPRPAERAIAGSWKKELIGIKAEIRKRLQRDANKVNPVRL